MPCRLGGLACGKTHLLYSWLMTTALVTGASRGIGRALARTLASYGHDVVLVARDADALSRVGRELGNRYGVKVSALTADLAARDDLTVVAEAAATADILVNNAGAALGAPFSRTAWDGDRNNENSMLALNVTAPTRLIHAALPGMRERGFGRILNIGSVAGTGPVWAASTYGPSKAYLLGLTRSLALSREIRASNVRLTCLVLGHAVSEFHEKAGLPPSPRMLTLPTRFVADTAVRAIHRRRPPITYIPGVRYKVLNFLLAHVPGGLTRIPGLVTDLSTVEK